VVGWLAARAPPRRHDGREEGVILAVLTAALLAALLGAATALQWAAGLLGP
jgi:hypothetical protein